MKPALMQTLRSSKWFKPVMIAAGAVVLLLIALLAIPALIDINTYRGQITRQMEQTLGRTVKLGKMDLRVLPSIKIQNSSMPQSSATIRR